MKSRSRSAPLAAVAAVVVAALAPARVGEDRAPDPPASDLDEVRPILERACFSCHGPERAKAGLRLDELGPPSGDEDDAETWSYVLGVVRAGEMPPEDSGTLSDEDRAHLIAWVEAELERAARAAAGTPRTVLRRLNRTQYANTLQELLGIDLDVSAELPPDERSKAGFSNNGATLGASALELETKDRLARAAVREALGVGPAPVPTRVRVRFGKDIGQGLVAGRTGGYQSVPLDTDDFVVEFLDADGAVRAPADDAEAESMDALRRRISVGLRGSSRNRFRVTDEGLVLYGAVPGRERAPSSWQGPSPNAKLELQRVVPERGRFALRVTASRGRVWRSRDPVLVPLEDAVPAVRLVGEAQDVEAPKDALVTPAEASDQRAGLTLQDGALVPEDETQDTKARFAFEVPSAGFWQVDLVHPTVDPARMPSVRLGLGKLDLDARPVLDETELELPRHVTVLGAAYLPEGRRHLELGGPFFTGVSALALTPLPPEHPLCVELEEAADVLEERAAGDDPVLRVYVGTRTDDGMDYATFGEPTVVRGAPGEWETHAFVDRFEHLPVPAPESGDTEILSGFLLLGLWNDCLVHDRRSTGPPLAVRSIELEAPFEPVWPPVSRARLLAPGEGLEDDAERAHAVLSALMSRAFRRPVEPEIVDAWMGTLWEPPAPAADFAESLVEPLVAALSSPRFLYMVEFPRGDGGGIDDWALASRLSYFLWNGPPDDVLLAAAERGVLRGGRGDAALRMLEDPRARRFVERFTEEWLRLDRLTNMTADPGSFPELTRYVARDMRLETLRFVEHALRADAPVATLVDADHTLLNENLARYYGIDGVRGPAFRETPLPEGSTRGGLLGQGSFLLGHSDGIYPHPIKRGVWLRARILGDPPPPPPPNVPELEPEEPGAQPRTLAERLAEHRSNASCRSCHEGIDPWGLALEGLGADGLPADVAPEDVTLPGGAVVDGARALKDHLLEHEQERIARALAAHLLGYGLGRDVGYADEATLDAIVEAARESGYGLRSLLRAVVESPAFVR